MIFDSKLADHAAKAHIEAAQLVRELCRIPAPSNHEEKRAEFCKNWFVANGFENVSVDGALNVLAPVNVTWRKRTASSTPPASPTTRPIWRS